MNDPQQDGHQRGVEEGAAADVEGPAEVLQQLRVLLLDGHQEGDQGASAESNCRWQEVFNEMPRQIKRNSSP